MRPTPPHRRLLCLIALLGACTIPGCAPKVSTAAIRPLEAAQLARWIADPPRKGGGVLIVDARKQSDFDQAHIQSARRLDLPDVPPDRNRDRWSRYSAIVVYGENPGSIRAEALTKRFMQLDAAPVYILLGGFEEWRRRSMPTQSADRQ